MTPVRRDPVTPRSRVNQWLPPFTDNRASELSSETTMLQMSQNLTLILPLFFVLNMSAYCVCFIYLSSRQNTFTIKANTMNLISGSILFTMKTSKVLKQMREQMAIIQNGKRSVKMSACYVCCIYSSSHKRTLTMEEKTLQTLIRLLLLDRSFRSSLIQVHIVCNKGNLST